MKHSQDFEVIIFTHKRAMQLHFLLESLYKQLSENTKVHIIRSTITSLLKKEEIKK